jgi:GT2 family glycosyltransferase
MTSGIFAHIVTFNNANCIRQTLQALLKSTLHEALHIEVTDNNSLDTTVAEINAHFGDAVPVHRNSDNLGFSAAHNQAVKRFLESSMEFFLILNPDLVVHPDALRILLESLRKKPEYGIGVPKLLRSDEALRPLMPAYIDAAGMIFDRSLRHFDRGSNELDVGQYDHEGPVIGGTGALLLFRRVALEVLLIPRNEFEPDIGRVYPQLLSGLHDRPQLFEEGFFAYREDAELALRASRLGVRALYIPHAIGYHRRHVLPEKRSDLAPELNLLGVKNRFLLQILHFPLSPHFNTWLQGFFMRNFVVILAVLVKECSSRPAFSQLKALFRRAWAQRKEISALATEKKR